MRRHSMKYNYLTDPGKVRERNEDSVIIVENASGEVLMCVCDGMGGHKNGEVASSIAITHISKRFKSISSVGNKDDAINWIQSTVSEANVEIFKYVKEHPESAGMGTTVVLAILTSKFLLFGNIGDSSGYVIKNKKLHKVTIDHTLVNLLVKSGELTEEEAKEHPRKNVLMRALGATPTVEIDIFNVELGVDGIMLCSDGLTNMLNDTQIMKVLNSDATIDEKLEKLIFKCNNRGGNDNISVALLYKEEM
jgi:protein phosphatase